MHATSEVYESTPDLSDPATFAEAVPHSAFKQLRKRPGLYWQPTDYGTLTGGFGRSRVTRISWRLSGNRSCFPQRRG